MQLVSRIRTFHHLKRSATILRFLNGCTFPSDSELNVVLKHKIEEYWRPRISNSQFNPQNAENKYYVLSMFPYPSGNLHMGHVRVYTTSDAIARFHRMCGQNVFQPIGWDAFGLPAENAAIQHGVEAKNWTEQNINQMRKQFDALGVSFDWNHEISTCNEDYYKWTQYLFLMLHKDGLAYQNEALVNWDPVDKTVLADEQVDANGLSWRSGAKVDKKFLRQWFIRTSVFASKLYENLDDPALQEWRDIKNLQRHWIGDCTGYSFMLLTSATNLLRIWTENPEYLKDPNAFVVLKSKHYFSKLSCADRLTVENPFAGTTMRVVFSDKPKFADKCDVYLAAPSFSDIDKELQDMCGLISNSFEFSRSSNEIEKMRSEVIEAAKRLKIGGYLVSSKLQDWLISRQRYWGTPIPIIHCDKCGAVPVPYKDLPVKLPKKLPNQVVDEEAYICTCPSCGNQNARRDTDTMDTFVDSSWYYLRFLDPHNNEQIFNEKFVKKLMPVDLYIGGKEHAVLHLYYARFVSHFLHSKGLLNQPEPFSRMLVQGMVMGRSYCLKNSGQYVSREQVNIIDEKKNRAELKDSKETVILSWEKMSKSKMNGVDPTDLFKNYGTDTIRLIILADVAPTSHRNWSNATFPGILNWQNRLWLTMNDFYKARTMAEELTVDTTSAEFRNGEHKIFDARNFYVKGATFNYRHSHQLSVAISKMQGLTNSLRKVPKDVIRLGKQYERALASQIIMLAPMAPHFASELWAKFVNTPGRLNADSDELHWSKDVFEQNWPTMDLIYDLDLTIKINGFENCVIKIAPVLLDKLTQNDAMDLAFSQDSVVSYLTDKKIRNTSFVLYPRLEAILHIYADKLKQSKEPSQYTSTKLVRK